MMVKVIAALAVAVLASAASAETQTLRPYASVASRGVNRVDTGYLPKPCSRFFTDYQLANSDTKKQGIFGAMSDGELKSALYIPNNSKDEVTWYYRSSTEGSIFWRGRDTHRRIVTVSNPTDVGGTVVSDVYARTSPTTNTYSWAHQTAGATAISLFALRTDGAYKEGSGKRIYCFEAADDTASVQPTVFLAPATNALGAAGFVDVVSGMFHGEAMSGVAASKALVFADGVGSAADYKFENGALYARCHAFAGDTAKGTVAFGAETPAGTAAAWVKRGESVTLTAVPANGQEFRGWAGDTWAITSGTVADAVVTVKSGTAVQLLAHFGDRSWRWTGAANDGKWLTPGNWIDPSGTVATELRSGDSFTFFRPGDQTVDYNPSEAAAFALGTVTFAPVCGKVTVTGAAIASLTNIVCENGEETSFVCPVIFAEAIDVTPTSGCARFAGGATGTGIVNHTTYDGDYTVTVADDWTPPYDSVLTSGSSLRLPEGTYYDHNNRLTIEEGAVVTVKNTKTAGTGVNYLLKSNAGVFKATGEIYSDTKLNINGNGGGYLEQSTGGGVFIAERLRMTEVLISPRLPTKTIVGAGGIMHGKNGYVRVGNTGALCFGSSADWQIYYNNHEHSDTTLKGIRKIASDGETVVTFDTTDYYDPAVGRTITAESGIGGQNSQIADTLNVVLLGKGRFVFANTGVNENDFGGGLTASNAVTVSVKTGARPGKGTVTLADTSTLEVAGSGTVTLGGALTLGEDASIAFRFTARDAAPCLAIPAGSTLPGTVNVKLSADDGLSFKTGTFTLTSGGAFAGKTVRLVDRPKWVRAVTVDAAGDLTVATTAGALTLFVR